MTENRQADTPFVELGAIFSEFFNPMMAQWDNMFGSDDSQKSRGFEGRLGESMESSAKMWLAMFGAMSEPEAMETFQKATQVTPDIALGFVQSCMSSFTSFQDHMNKWIRKRAEVEDPVDIQALDKEFIRQWKKAYEKEFSQYFKIPQIGLNRFYQERAMNAVDKRNMFQSTLFEFLHALYLPLEKSFKSLQEKMVEMTADEGSLDEKSKTYYNLWIKLLEGHYMELFKHPEFIDSLLQTLSALEEYSGARQAVVNDLLKMYAIPSHNDLDDLYKEIYILKKRMRAYEKKK
ncbi:MAG: poly(R)-hydroxyalkanoic acid synthase subunit PhaE [Desulfobacteraceae bacterium]|jgi:hypothetical protein